MRSFDSYGRTITIPVPAADFGKYTAGDQNVAVGEHVGITSGPVDQSDGSLVLNVEGVYRRDVTATAAASNVKVYMEADGTLTTDENGNTLFGRVIGALKAGVNADALVRLIG